MGKWSLIGAWALVVVLATTVTWQIVSAADEQVSDRPVALQVEAPLAISTDSTTTIPTDTSGVADPTTSTPVTQAGSPSSTATTTQSGPLPTTAGGTSTTAAAWKSQSIPTSGGVVVVRYRSGEVVLSSATPSPGFAADIKKSGPDVVEVEFEGEESKYEVKVRWANGDLQVQTDSDTEND